MIDPDVYIIKAVVMLKEYVKYKFIAPLTVTIGGIPLTAITFFILLLVLGGMWYEYSSKDSMTLAGRFCEKVQTSAKFTKWIVVSAFSLIGFILFIL
jgi:hypothetical protein